MTSRADRFTVLLDANVLAPSLARNMLLSLAHAGLYRVRWTEQILGETERAIARIIEKKKDSAAKDDPADIAANQIKRVRKAFPEALVTGHEVYIPAITLPDEDDRHVLAAAVHIRAEAIITDNLKDFPPETLSAYDVEAMSLDEFLADMIDLAGAEAVSALQAMRQRFKNPEFTREAFLRRLESLELLKTASALEEYNDLL
tara:strand:+ start:543 stop:1148 length:606 start_codon:yes stop_codon:yes gene_type:complete